MSSAAAHKRIFYSLFSNSVCNLFAVTKAAEKVSNIKAAIAVFEKWIEENGGGSSNKNTKTDAADKPETVPGLGFKDKEAAEKSLK